jgi:hypothetical protein
LGLEDFQSTDPRRFLSATRNIFAGILLLFKHKLSELSPAGSDEALSKESVFPTVTPNRHILWKGRGKKTVDVRQIEDRLTSLGIKADWARVKQINDYRNNVEHYFSSLSVKKEGCVSTLKQVDWCSGALHEALLQAKCPECGSDLITLAGKAKLREDNDFLCRACEKKWEFEDFVEEAIKQSCSWDNYVAVKDGGEVATIECPRCRSETYLMAEQQCANCLEALEHTCQRCGNAIPPEELFLDNGYCGWCEHMMNKDD